MVQKAASPDNPRARRRCRKGRTGMGWGGISVVPCVAPFSNCWLSLRIYSLLLPNEPLYVANAPRLCYLGSMFVFQSRPRTRLDAGLRSLAVAIVLCLGASTFVAVTEAPSEASPTPSGPVDVLSAGSLQDLMQDQVAPAFHKATGDPLFPVPVRVPRGS